MHDIWPSLSCVIYMENSNQELKSVALPVSKLVSICYRS